MKTAIAHYEAALKEAFPSGATGDVFHHWNEARKALEQTAREWVGLTDEDVTWLCDNAKSHDQTWGMFVRAIEAKLKKKNGG